MSEIQTLDWRIFSLMLFVGASVLLYVVFGGADYGAGIIEALPLKKNREHQTVLINHAMGPVWEANHMWLILLIVILFMGFPKAYLLISTSLHIPVVAILVGVLIRGAVFVFRHYDPHPNDGSQRIFTRLFAWASVWTSFWLGVTAASLFRGTVRDVSANPSQDFYSAYVASWWGPFPVAMGFFVIVIFTFMASIFLIEEAATQGAHSSEAATRSLAPIFQKRFRSLAFAANVLVVIVGAAVFVCAHQEGLTLAQDFFTHAISLVCLALATVLFGVLWVLLKNQNPFLVRVTAAGQTALILLGWYSLEWPNVLITREGPLSFAVAAAPSSTITQLLLALAIGSLLIFPSLFFLLRVFKSQNHRVTY